MRSLQQHADMAFYRFYNPIMKNSILRRKHYLLFAILLVVTMK